jgi:pimeloyl-ACP methyl ester carboxylesterase
LEFSKKKKKIATMWARLLALFFLFSVGSAIDACRIVPQGPDGDAFYNPPAQLPQEDHGALIWYRPLTGPKVLSGGANTLLLYTQEGINGNQVATSGFMVVPDGDAPEGGWPVITWAHGTTGIADQCAPSRDTDPSDGDSTLFETWISKGYAIVLTDYEGLGTPGIHPYLIGNSEGRAVLDIIRAARTYEPKLSNHVVIAGHSQGGQAALFAASLAPSYTPEVELAGTIAFAPVSNLETQIPVLKGLTIDSLSGTVALILRGLTVANSSIDPATLLTPAAEALFPQTLTVCENALDANNSFGGLAGDQLLQPNADISGIILGLKDNDASFLKIQKPILVLQGEADLTVFPFTTAALVKSLQGNGADVTENTYPNTTHTGVIAAGASDATKFLVQMLPATQ